MKEYQVTNKKLLVQLESENNQLSHRARAMSKLCEGWLSKNKLLLLNGLPKLSLKQYKETINYKTNDALVILAGVDETWLMDYQDRIKQRQIACNAYHEKQTINSWIGLSEFTRIVTIGVLLSLLVCSIYILLY